jgi:hypothetical protein
MFEETQLQDVQSSNPLPVTTKCGSPAYGLNIRQCSPLRESSGKRPKRIRVQNNRETSRRANLNLPHQKLLGFIQKEFRDTFIPPVSALHVPIEIVGPVITFLRRTIEIATGDYDLISMPHSPRALNVQGIFPNFSGFAATVLNGLAPAKLKPFQISRAT